MRTPKEREPIHVLVAGEALIDFVPASAEGACAYRPMPGGSPFNVAVGLARLGISAGLLAKLSTDRFGQLLRSYLEESGVDGRFLLSGGQPSTLAFVFEEGSEPEYAFFGEGAADRQLSLDEVPTDFPESLQAIHLGSFAMACEPIGSSLTRLMEREHDRRLISFDPNVRPSLIGDEAGYRAKLEGWIRSSHIVKASRADLAFIAPTRSNDEIAADWLRLGPSLVVITQGPQGAVAYTRGERVEAPAQTVNVVDSVGAGDAFTSGMLAWLDRSGRLTRDALPRLSPRDMKDGLAYAQRVAAVACSRAGADPPHRWELG